MARPRTVTDQQILLAAREIFVAEGHGASVASIAGRIGVTPSAVLQRFGSKRHLFLSAMCPEGPPDRVMVALTQGPAPDLDLHAQLRPMLGGLLSFLRELLPQLLALRAAGAALVPEASESMPARLRVALAGWVRAAGEAGRAQVVDAGAVAEGLLGALEARALNEHLGAAARVPEDDAAYFDTLLRGLLPTTPTAPLHAGAPKKARDEPTQE